MHCRDDIPVLVGSLLTHHLAERAKFSLMQMIRRPRQILRQPNSIYHFIITAGRPNHLREDLPINIT
jgi:hypothetical protein